MFIDRDSELAVLNQEWNQKVDYTVYNELIRKAALVDLPPGLGKNWVIFSKSGFKDSLENAAGRFYTYWGE